MKVKGKRIGREIGKRLPWLGLILLGVFLALEFPPDFFLRTISPQSNMNPLLPCFILLCAEVFCVLFGIMGVIAPEEMRKELVSIFGG